MLGGCILNDFPRHNKEALVILVILPTREYLKAESERYFNKAAQHDNPLIVAAAKRRCNAK